MSKSIEATGKTIDEAIENALRELGCDRSDASVEVLDQYKAGFFGIGGTPARVRVTYEETRGGKATDFLEGLLTRMGANARPIVEAEDEEALHIRLEGENMGLLIGRRGDTLNAIQHITNYVVNRGEEQRTRVIVDIENYREKREESLKKLAEKTAAKVVRFRRNISLEPMNAYERHVVHTALSDFKDVVTFSSGSEPRRCVVVSYAPGGKRPAQSAGGHPGGKPRRSGGGRPRREDSPRDASGEAAE